MNPSLDLINSHRSIRKFLPKAVSDEILTNIAEAASRASSSGNMQAYSIIVTTDEELKRKLYPLHFEQEMLLEAPVLMTFCSDFYRMREWLKISDAPLNFDNFMSFMIGAIDAILASQNAALAAEAHGLGICYMGTTLANAHLIGPLLNCPPNVVPVVGFVLGYPAEKIEKRDRLATEAIVHKNTYQRPNRSELIEIYKNKEHTAMKRYKNILEKNPQDLCIKNLAQIYTKLKYTRESHIEYSSNLLKFLKDQNFLNTHHNNEHHR